MSANASEMNVTLSRKERLALTNLDFDSVFTEDFLFVTVEDDDDYITRLKKNTKYAHWSWHMSGDWDSSFMFASIYSSLFRPPAPVLRNSQTVRAVDACAHVLTGNIYASRSLDDVAQDVVSFLMAYAVNGFSYFSTDSEVLEQRVKEKMSHQLLMTRGSDLWRFYNFDEGLCDIVEMDIIEYEILKRCKHLLINSESALIPGRLNLVQKSFEIFCLSDKVRRCNIAFPLKMLK